MRVTAETNVETTTHRKREREKEGENNKKKFFTQRFLSLSPRGRAWRIKKKRDKLLVKSVVNS